MAHHEIAVIVKNDDLQYLLLQLAAVADQTYSDLLSPGTSPDDFKDQALIQLENQSDLCININPDRLKVLPKVKPPRYGLTPRSLSQYLALCQGVEVTPYWHRLATTTPSSPSKLNLLLVPFPYQLDSAQFQPQVVSGHQLPDEFGYFRYDPQPAIQPEAIADWVEQLLTDTKRGFHEEIHLIVFPETSLRQEDYDAIVNRLSNSGSFSNIVLVAGVSPPRGLETLFVLLSRSLERGRCGLCGSVRSARS